MNRRFIGLRNKKLNQKMIEFRYRCEQDVTAPTK